MFERGASKVSNQTTNLLIILSLKYNQNIFEIIDWDKWDDVCGDFFKGPGLVYDPPQRSMPSTLLDDDEMVWFQRSVFHFPED